VLIKKRIGQKRDQPTGGSCAGLSKPKGGGEREETQKRPTLLKEEEGSIQRVGNYQSEGDPTEVAVVSDERGRGNVISKPANNFEKKRRGTRGRGREQ